MPLRRPLLAVLAVASLFTAFEARAASDYLLKIDGIEGESVLKGFEKQIEVLSWSWGVTNTSTGSGSGARAGKACPSDMSFAKNVDKATPPLIAGAVGGTVSSTAILIGLRPGGGGGAPETYIKYEMKNVMVTSYQTGGSSGGGIAADSFALRFGSATVTYYAQDAKGQVKPVAVTNLQGC